MSLLKPSFESIILSEALASRLGGGSAAAHARIGAHLAADPSLSRLPTHILLRMTAIEGRVNFVLDTALSEVLNRLKTI